MTAALLIQLVTSGLTFVGMWLAGRKDWRGWAVGLLNQVCWLARLRRLPATDGAGRVMTVDEEVCAVCNGERVVERRTCAPTCRLRHAPECPVVRLVPCPMCEKRELGEDLNG